MKVTRFRDLPTEGWFSMERYADELGAALRNLGVEVRDYVLPRPLPQVKGRMGAWLNYAWRLTAYPLAARTQQGEVNHIIDHSYAHLLNALDARRTVVTCHDIAPLALGQTGLSRRLWQRSFDAMLHAAHIVADSDHTRAEILRHTRYPSDQVSIVPLGVAPRFQSAAQPQSLLRPPTLLHVGACVRRKNVEGVLHALVMLPPDVRLIQVGGTFTKAQRELIRTLGLRERVRQLHGVSDEELHGWYRAASVFVFPSLYEGFGLPVLEAMACGTPVVCSNASSLPEVAGEAALLCNPNDPLDLADKVKALLSNAALRRRLSEAGRQRAATFTWERTARATLAVYERVVT